MTTLTRSAALAVLAPGMGGCNAIFGHHGTVADASPGFEDADREEIYALAALEKGRSELAMRNYAAAADAFHLATAHPRTRADANNGLGVVYAKLGRFDLSRRFFTVAAELQPDNPQFAANLGRLDRDAALAELARDPESRQLAAAPQARPFEMAIAAQPQVIRVELPSTAPRSLALETAPDAGAAPRPPVVRVALGQAKPLAEGEFIGQDGRISRVSSLQSCVRTVFDPADPHPAEIVAREQPATPDRRHEVSFVQLAVK